MCSVECRREQNVRELWFYFIFSTWISNCFFILEQWMNVLHRTCRQKLRLSMYPSPPSATTWRRYTPRKSTPPFGYHHISSVTTYGTPMANLSPHLLFALTSVICTICTICTYISWARWGWRNPWGRIWCSTPRWLDRFQNQNRTIWILLRHSVNRPVDNVTVVILERIRYMH